MSITVNGKEIATDEKGYLLDHNEWDEDVARAMAEAEGLELTQEHWDLINYLREQYIEHNVNPNTRTIIKDMSKLWGKKVGSKDLYNLFPKDPSKQGGRIAGLPESKRKGGY